jgi:hypothetical protein
MEGQNFKNDCGSCSKADKNLPAKKYSGWLTGVLFVILPKCPFCFLAYSSTMVLCAKDSITTKTSIHYSESTLFITMILCLIVLISILMNFRDRRSVYAIGLALTGSAVIVTSALYLGGAYLYYLGVMILFTGVWMNGSMFYILHKLKNRKKSGISLASIS